MSALTESGRAAFRDQQRNRMTSALRKHEWFAGMPSPVLAGYAELLLIAKTLRANIKREGIMRPDGTLNPCVEQFRKYKHTELGYLTMIADMRRSEHEQARDLVSEMATAIDLPADLPEPALATPDGAEAARDEPVNIEPER